MFFGTAGLYRSDMLCLFSAWFCPCVQMFRWFCPSTFFFARHQHDTLSSLPPETLDVAARDSGDRRVQGTEPDIVNGSILQLIALAFVCWRYFNSLHRADEPQQGRNSCPRLQSYFIGFCRVGVSQSQLFYVVSALQFCMLS